MKVFNQASADMTSRVMALSTKAISRSLGRLSSGKRVNSAADGPADFATINTLDSKIRGLNEAAKSATRTTGLLQTADAAISVQMDIVQRMKELAIEASSDTLSTAQRDAINGNLASLMQEFVRISNETDFEGANLLDGSFGDKQILIGNNYDNEITISLPSLQASNAFKKVIGTGAFKPSQTAAVGTTPEDIAVADFNKDGIQDLVSLDSGTTDAISVRLGRADGTFLPAQTQAAGGAGQDIRVGDVNGDGLQDIVVSDNSATKTIDIYLGNGNGTFKPKVTYAVQAVASSEFVLTDLNNDRALDIVVGNSGTNQISILMNKGDGTFNSEQTFATATGQVVNDLAAGDFNKDGFQDILTVRAGTGDYQLLLGDGTGNFTGQSTAATGGTSANLTVGDLDNDGDLDFVVANGNSTNVDIRLNDGTATFTAATDFTAGGALLEIALADYNGDGYADLIGRNASGAFLATGNGAGGFTQKSSLSGTFTAGLQAADIENDGVMDLFLVNSATSNAFYYEMIGYETSAASDVSVSTSAKAQKLVKVLSDSLDTLLEERNAIGRTLGQLESIVSFNESQSESLTEGKSSVEDVDVSAETSELVKQQILQQAQIAMLAQNNTNSQLVLGLIVR